MYINQGYIKVRLKMTRKIINSIIKNKKDHSLEDTYITDEDDDVCKISGMRPVLKGIRKLNWVYKRYYICWHPLFNRYLTQFYLAVHVGSVGWCNVLIPPSHQRPNKHILSNILP